MFKKLGRSLLFIAALVFIFATRVNAMSYEGTLLFENDGFSAKAAVVDSQKGFAYLGTTAAIVKIDLNTFRRVGSIPLNPDETDGIRSGVIDAQRGFAYFGTLRNGTASARILKVQLSDFSLVPLPPSKAAIYIERHS